MVREKEAWKSQAQLYSRKEIKTNLPHELLVGYSNLTLDKYGIEDLKTKTYFLLLKFEERKS